MIQVKNRVTLPARRISAEEFCGLVRQTQSSIYRPRSELMRMLAIGEAWGACAEDGTLEAALLLLPMDADTELAAGLRALEGRLPEKAFFLTPPLGNPAFLPPLLKAAKQSSLRAAPKSSLRLILEPGKDGLDKQQLKTCFAAGFSLQAIRPLETVMPLALLSDAANQTAERGVWVPLEDATHLALLLARGWVAVGDKESENGRLLRLVPKH